MEVQSPYDNGKFALYLIERPVHRTLVPGKAETRVRYCSVDLAPERVNPWELMVCGGKLPPICYVQGISQRHYISRCLLGGWLIETPCILCDYVKYVLVQIWNTHTHTHSLNETNRLYVFLSTIYRT